MSIDETVLEPNENVIKFAKLREKAIIPSRRPEDGCYDVYACLEENMIIMPGEIRLVPTGIISAFSSKNRIQLRERGSTGTKGMARRAGEIDSGYRGEWFVAINNTSTKPIMIYVHEVANQEHPFNLCTLYPANKAIAQAAVEFVPQVSIEEVSVEEVQSYVSERGDSKLGASGK